MSNLQLSEMIEALRLELAVAQKAGEGDQLKFEVGPVELEVEIGVTKTTTGGAGVKFWVVEAGVDRERADAVTHRVKVTLHPKRADGSGPVEVADDISFESATFPPRR